MIIIKNIWKEEAFNVFLKANIHIPQTDIERWITNVSKFEPQLSNRRLPLPLNDKGDFEMWYQTSKEYADAFCWERCDAFVVACLYFAMISGADIESKVPISYDLLYQLNEQIIPLFCNQNTDFHRIKVIAEPTYVVSKVAHYVGTGVSCGVDSFSSILMGLKDGLPDKRRVTHLAVFNTGSLNFYGYQDIQSLQEWRKETVEELCYHANIAKEVAADLHLKSICIDTNIPDLYQGCFLLSHTFRNNSCVLATQKIWGCYYYASAGEGPIFQPNLKKDCAFSDAFVLPNLSIEGLSFYSVGFEMLRMEKLKMIADNPIVRKYLNVCSYGKKNCGHCTKCIRTMVALDIMGRLDDFIDVFEDVSYYRKYRWKFITHMREASDKDIFYYDMQKYARKNGFRYSIKENLYHCTYPLRRLRMSLIKLFCK